MWYTTRKALVLADAMHSTASVFINDDAGLWAGCTSAPAKLASGKPLSRGNRGNNADAHLKHQIMGREVVVAVTNGRLNFGTWERIFYGRSDASTLVIGEAKIDSALSAFRHGTVQSCARHVEQNTSVEVVVVTPAE